MEEADLTPTRARGVEAAADVVHATVVPASFACAEGALSEERLEVGVRRRTPLVLELTNLRLEVLAYDRLPQLLRNVDPLRHKHV